MHQIKKKDPYRFISKVYDIVTEPLSKGLRLYGLLFYPVSQNSKILDIGCGTGSNLVLYNKSGCSVYGIDPSENMLAVAQKKLGESACLIHGNATHLSFSDDSFDFILISMVLHEMPHVTRENVLNEINRVLKPTGRLLIVDYHTGPFTFPKGYLFKAVTICLEILAGKEHYTNYKDFIHRNGLKDLISKHQFVIEKFKCVSGGNIVLKLLRKSI
ncbi:MAG: methyltransferase domain-containing protein [Candidatus Magnetomorum sp.]|nr:methyltransferase domain-containing protein [Candidatus Magnetomorum sp.]